MTHPLQTPIYHAIAALFYAAPRLLYQMRVVGARNFRQRASTLIVVNHKRDLDSVILPPTLLYNGVSPKRPMWFAGREDMFLRGYLASYDVVPRPLRRLLYELDLTPVLGALRILPVRRFRERTMEEALREAVEILGDLPLSEALAAEEVARWHQAGRRAPTRLRGLLDWQLYGAGRRPATLRAFAPSLRERLRRLQDEVVARQMQALADVLRRGDALYLAPEGVISPDGRLQAFRSGLRQVLALAGAPIRLLPACIVYDFMRRGPLTVHVVVGEEMEASGPPPQVEVAARHAIAALHVMTPSQIVSQAVWDLLDAGREAVNFSHVTTRAQGRAEEWRDAGLRVDGALLGSGAAECIAGWARYVAAKGWASVRAGELRFEGTRLRETPASHWGNPVRYCVNEVRSVLTAVAPLSDHVTAAASS